jgi:hypothetical protein
MPLVDLRVRHLCALLLGCWAANKLPLRLHPEDRDNQEKKETYMSKNLTRKGLALGAIVALGTSLFAGAPAFAGVESTGLTLAPKAGTTYNSIAGSSFDLSTVVNSNIETTTVKAAKLSYLITNSGAASVKVGFKTASADVTDYAHHAVRFGATAATVGASSVDSVDTSVSLTNKAIVVTGNASNVGYNSASVGANHLIITSSSDATENVVLTVQAFIDENSNGLIDDFDLTSPARTLTFIPAANVTATTSITSAVIGASTITGKVVLGNDINMANIGTDVKVGFTLNGAVVPMNYGSSSRDIADVSWDSTEAGLLNLDGQIVKSSDASNDTLKSGTLIAQAYYKTSATKLGTTSAASAPATGTLSSDSVDIVDIKATADVKRENTTARQGTSATVRAGASVITFSSTVTWHSNDTKDYASPAGVSVMVTLNAQNLDSASSFTAGGKTLTATSGDQTFYVLTDSLGAVSFTGSGTGKALDSVRVTLTPLLKNGAYGTGAAVTSYATVTYAAAAVAAPINTDVKGASGELKATAGSTYTLNYSIVDQFKQALVSTASYRLKVTTTGGTSGASFLYYAPVVAGKASQAIVDNSAAAGKYTVTAKLEKLNATTNVWANAQDATPADLASADVVVNVNAIAASAVSATATSSVAVATIAKTLVNADLRVDDGTNNAKLIGYGSGATVTGTHHTISGVVTQASGATVAGAAVTLTGAGLGFIVNDKVYSIGSATVNADANGAYTVDVYSTTAGKQTVVVTSGAATKSVVIEYSGVTALAETNVVSIDVASLSQVGRSVTATVKVVDKFANPVSGVAVAVSVTGVGSLSAATVTTGTAGTATVQFVAGANDFGDAVITAKYTATDAAATVVTTSKTLTVGVTDAQVDVVNNRVTAVASFSKGKTVGFYVDGVKKWSKLSASDADVVVNYNLKKGTHTVTVKISGGFVTTEKFIVK